MNFGIIEALGKIERDNTFSLIEVKNEFGRRHDANLQSMSQLHQEMAEMKSDLKLIADFVKDMIKK